MKFTNQDIKERFKEKFPEIIFDEELKKYTTLFIGGKADFFCVLKDFKKLPEIIKFTKDNKIPYLFIGKGSNILFTDKGFRGLVIKNATGKISVKKNEITAESGVLTANLLSESLKNGFTGIEKWIGLPGTVGGLVYGNAGCNGVETKNLLVSAVVFDPDSGKIKKVKNSYFDFKYRDSKLKRNNEIVIEATFKLKKSKLLKKEQNKIIAELNKKRIQRQPWGLSAGSFFRNPSIQSPAGLLIEKSGLKGKKIGKAQISEKHANFIVNIGGATAEDVRKLAKLAQRKVKEKFKIKLTEEVQILSEHGKSKL